METTNLAPALRYPELAKRMGALLQTAIRGVVEWPIPRGRALGGGLALMLGFNSPAAWSQSIHSIDPVPSASPTTVTAIVGATLIDGRGGPPVPEATVLVRGNRILAVGPSAAVPVPPDAERVEARGLTVLPGLIDAHFHRAGSPAVPSMFLANGVTTLRDPGVWTEDYADIRSHDAPLPRIFLTGPHLDSPPPAYPANSLIVRDEDETRRAIEDMAAAGASAIKAYYRLPLGLLRVAAQTGDSLGLPVTAHLEIVDARDAIRAGIDGIEHVTSFGTALSEPKEAEVFRQAVLADNAARRPGRYRLWSALDLGSARVGEVVDLLVRYRVFLSPTLAVFERRAGDQGATEVDVRGFEKMLSFVGMARRGGATVVVGSHGSVPHAQRGWAYHREMELLVEAGLTPMETIVAATLENARFLRVDDRLGTIEAGKLADLVLIAGDPTRDMGAMRQVRRVMLNGLWIR